MSKRLIVVAAALAGITLIVYAGVRSSEFVNYDDGAYVTENRHVTTGLTAENIAWAFRPESSEPTSNWHPLTWLSLMADVSIFGENASAMHLENLAFHVLNTLLLLFLLVRLTGDLWPSTFVAAVFAVHPLHVESVAWISERKDVLSTFFLLLSMLAHCRYISTERRRWQGVSLLCFVLSLLSKQMYVTLPFLLFLLDYWPLKRMALLSAEPGHPQQVGMRRLLAEKLPYLLIAVGFAAIAYAGQSYGGAVGSVEKYPILMRILNACVSYLSYVGMTVWPRNLAVFYPYPDTLPWAAAAVSLSVVAGVTLLAVRLRRTWPQILVGWLWYLGTLVPVIGLVQIGRQRMADRYMYFPMIGLLVALAWTAAEWIRRDPARKKALAVAGIACVLALSLVARVQVTHWRNSMALFSHASRAAESSLAYTKLAYEYAQSGQLDEAERLLLRALTLDSEHVPSHAGLGNVCLSRGDLERAVTHFRRAIEIDPDHAEAHYNLGIIATALGQPGDAIRHYQSAMRITPEDPSLQTNLGIACLMLGRPSEGIRYLEAALRTDPDLPEAHFALGKHYAANQQDEQAIAHLKIVLSSRPDLAGAHLLIAEVYERNGQSDLAARHRNRVQ